MVQLFIEKPYHSYRALPTIWHHGVTSHPTWVNMSRLNPSKT